MSAAVFEERIDPGQLTSVLLSAAVHLILLAVLIFGVRWQSRPPESIAVELWEAPPPAPVVEAPKPLPKVEPPPPPVVKPEPRVEKPEIKLREPEKVKPAPKPVPKLEPKPVPKPVPKVEPKPVPKPVVKPEPFKPKVDERRIREEMARELAREQQSLAIDRERQQIRDQLARDAATLRNRSTAEYEAKIRNKVRGNIVLPTEIQGNPEAHFLVVQLPTGEVLSSKLVRSSGNRAYDEAVERAILKSSPLPRPDRPELFSRELRLTFRPRD